MKSSYLSMLVIFFCSLSFTTHEAQTKWYKYVGNPVLEKGDAGSWEDTWVLYQHVIWDGTEYKMWYRGFDGGTKAIGLATSADGINWEKYENNPVLEKGAPGEWDAEDIRYNYVLYDGSLYRMWYNSTNVNGIGLATSADGINWEKYENNPVLEKGASGSWDDHAVHAPSVIFENSIYKMWYSGTVQNPNMGNYYNFRIGYAESIDGITWVKRPEPVLEEGDYVTWANDLMEPCVVYDGNNYNMWYARSNTSIDDWHIDCAVSPNGIDWVKFESNPVLSHESPPAWDERFIGGPTILVEDNLYKMWYTGDDGQVGYIGYAEDFSNLVHADSIIIESYVKPNSDPVNILGRVISSEGHSVSAKALVLSDDEPTQDSLDLFDDGLNGDGAAGDGIYGGYLPVANENNYTVAIKTIDHETGFTRVGFDWGITDRFTTKGPVVLESMEILSNHTEFNAGDRVNIQLNLMNEGVLSGISDIDVELIMPAGMRNTTTGVPVWGDIDPGEVVGNANRHLSISVDDTCTSGLHDIVLAIKSNNKVWWYDTLTVTDVEDELTSLPNKFALEQNYPNPFNPTTTIEYSIPANSRQHTVVSSPDQTIVTLKVYDILGREVALLVNEHQRSGTYQVKFDASSLSSGIYYYQLNAGSFIETKKMLMLK